LLALPATAAAQAGRVGGRVVDAATGRPIAGARVAVIVSPVRSAVTGVDGTYVIRNVPLGSHSVAASHLGHATKTVTGVAVTASGVNLDISLAVQAVGIQGIVVSAARERGSVNRALDEQRNAPGVVNSITSEQIARSPDSDAAQAVQRVSGVTVSEGKFVVVRGMSERYTTTSLNGARIPSPEPERKLVPLDLFPTGIIQQVTTSKTFTPDLPGDFAGAHVNIRTREYPAKRSFVFSTSLGYNDAITGRGAVFAPRSGGELFAWTGSERRVPGEVRAGGDLKNTFTQNQVNRFVGSFRNAWSARQGEGSPNSSYSASLGGSDPVFGQRIGYLLSGSYSYTDEVRADDYRSNFEQTEQTPINSFSSVQNTGRAGVLWGGVANLSTNIGTHTRVSSNNIYNRSADNEARLERGLSDDLGNSEVEIERLRYVERVIRSNQLTAEHRLFGDHQLDWSLTSSGVDRREPDRSEIVYGLRRDGAGQIVGREWYRLGTEVAVRTFGDLDEESLEGSFNYRLRFGSENALRFGGNVRRTERDAENRSYGINNGAAVVLTPEEAALRPEEIFGGRFIAEGASYFQLLPLLQGGSYSARDDLSAGYVMADYRLGRVQLVGGARVEHSDVLVSAVSQSGETASPNPTYTDVLPSLAVNVDLTDVQKLRFSASRTVARPEYREFAPFTVRDILGGPAFEGFPGIRRTTIQNFDARYEWYPSNGEVLSVALFAKLFDDPIERLVLPVSGAGIVSVRNTESARNLGVELEARKGLGVLGEALEPFTAFTNVTLMKSSVTVPDSLNLNDDRALVGQAPYVVNAGLTWTPGTGPTSATLLYNTVGERIYAAAGRGLPEVVERPRHVLDLALRMGVARGLTARFDAKNLLDAAYETRQGPVVRESYRSGRTFTVGLSVQR
jgi:outer membrane receptor for ferrienterochelin and colicin